MTRLVWAPVAMTVPLVFAIASWVQPHIDPPCDPLVRGLVQRADDGSWIRVLEGTPGHGQHPCRMPSSEARDRFRH